MTSHEERERQARQIDRVHREAEHPMDVAEESALSPDIPPDRTRQFRYVGFSRMRTTFAPEDRIKMEEINGLAWDTIRDKFLAAFDLMDRIWMIVRKPVVEDGEIVLDRTGRPKWRLNEAGFPIEDWTMITDADRDNFLWEVSTHLFIWEQDAVVLWGEAMFAKGIWEGKFAFGFTDPVGKLTIDDRTQLGHLSAMEDRFFGIYKSVLSRRADAIIKSMRQIERRLARE